MQTGLAMLVEQNVFATACSDSRTPIADIIPVSRVISATLYLNVFVDNFSSFKNRI
jgi:hypothetical protein